MLYLFHPVEHHSLVIIHTFPQIEIPYLTDAMLTTLREKKNIVYSTVHCIPHYIEIPNMRVKETHLLYVYVILVQNQFL